MSPLKAGIAIAISLVLSGCFLTTSAPLISPEKAEFPLTMEIGEKKTLTHCERNDEDFSDWTECRPLQLERAEHHYVVTTPDEPDEVYTIRFAPFKGAAAYSRSEYVFQLSNTNPKDEEHIYGLAKFGGDKLFMGLGNAKFIREETCLSLGAEYPSVEKSCMKAIDSYDELQTALRDISDAVQYTMYIAAPDA